MKAVKSEIFYTANDMPRIGMLLLASGSSTRMGEPKLLLPWKGKTVIEATLSIGQDFPSLEKLMVVPPFLPALKSLGKAYSWHIVENEAPSRGQASSLVEGLLWWEKTGLLDQLDGVLCMVGDQPYLSSAIIDEMVRSFDKEKVIIPQYGEQPGNPVLFGARWFSQLKELQGDEGGRQIIRQLREEERVYLSFPPLAGHDMDTFAAYEELLVLLGTNR